MSKSTYQEQQEAFEAKFGEAGALGVEALAKELHEAGRAAVEQGQTVAAEKFGDPSRKFLEWDEITETARAGRRIQAAYLLAKFNIREK